jgi:hypothetical protein
MRQLFRSKAATGTGTGGAITVVAATTTAGTAATTMAGGIIVIGGNFHLRPKKGTPVVGGLISLKVVDDGRSHFGRYR